MGAGDIKLMAAMGLLLGWQNALLAIFLAALGGSLAGLALRRSRHQEMPFGPWLALGSWVAFLWGERLVALYLAWVLG
jgi:leader peptidase (prepilin peptidase)/N-methyltransferase